MRNESRAGMKAKNILFFSENLRRKVASGARPACSSSQSIRHTEHPPLSPNEEHMDFMTVSCHKVHHLILPTLNIIRFTSVPEVGARTGPQPRAPPFLSPSTPWWPETEPLTSESGR